MARLRERRGQQGSLPVTPARHHSLACQSEASLCRRVLARVDDIHKVVAPLVANLNVVENVHDKGEFGLVVLVCPCVGAAIDQRSAAAVVYFDDQVVVLRGVMYGMADPLQK